MGGAGWVYRGDSTRPGGTAEAHGGMATVESVSVTLLVVAMVWSCWRWYCSGSVKVGVIGWW